MIWIRFEQVLDLERGRGLQDCHSSTCDADKAEAGFWDMGVAA
jgi:hypothetical protein